MRGQMLSLCSKNFKILRIASKPDLVELVAYNNNNYYYYTSKHLQLSS